MKKKLLALVMVATLVFAFTACGGNESPGGDTASEEAEKEEPLDLTGDWQQVTAEGDGMKATIEGEEITIDWVFEEDDTTALYWAGTYVPPTEAIDEYSWTSENDTEKTSSALMASTGETKDFTYKDGALSFEVSALGVTKTVELERAE